MKNTIIVEKLLINGKMSDVNNTQKDSLPGTPKTPTNNINVSTPKNQTNENQTPERRNLTEMSPIRFENDKYLDATPPWEQNDVEQLRELMRKGQNISTGEAKTKEKLMAKYHSNILTHQVRVLSAGLENQKKELDDFNADRHMEKRTLELEIEQLRGQFQDKLIGPSATSTPVSRQEDIAK